MFLFDMFSYRQTDYLITNICCMTLSLLCSFAGALLRTVSSVYYRKPLGSYRDEGRKPFVVQALKHASKLTFGYL